VKRSFRLALVFLFLAGYGCKKHNQNPDGFALTLAEPVTIDPSFVTDEAGAVICQNIFEGLLNNPPDDGPMRPGVAERYEVLDNGTRYLFHLRGDARWSDGTPVTTADFVYAYQRALDPKNGTRGAELFFIIQGARDYNLGKIPFKQVGIRALSPRELEIRLAAPAPYFPRLLGYAVFAPLPRRVVERWGGHWIEPGKIVTNGPYIPTTYLREAHSLLK